jgi:hypothetical protein
MTRHRFPRGKFPPLFCEPELDPELRAPPEEDELELDRALADARARAEP